MLFILALLMTGCSLYKDANPGFYVTRIYGQVTKAENDSENINQTSEQTDSGNFGLTRFSGGGQALVVAVSRRRSFMELKNSPIFFESYSARLADPQGFYQVRWEPDAVNVTVYMFMAGRVYKSRQFSSTLGVGSFEFNEALDQADDWQSTLRLIVTPILSGFLSGEPNQISESDRSLISEWLAHQDSLLSYPLESQP